MKRIYTLLLSLLIVGAAFAQKSQMTIKGEVGIQKPVLEKPTLSKEEIVVLEMGFDDEDMPWPPITYVGDDEIEWATVETNAAGNIFMYGNPSSLNFDTVDPNSIMSVIVPYDDDNASDEWMITPNLDVANLTSLSLLFYAGTDNDWLAYANILVKVSTDDGGTWTQVWSAVADPAITADWLWVPITLDLTAYTGGNVRVAWQYVGQGGNLWGLDGILISGEVGGVTDVTLSDLTVAGTTVTGFAPATLEYTVSLPAGTTEVPVVAATATDAAATVAIEAATALPGTTNVVVTNGTATQTYMVHFTVEGAETFAVTFKVDLTGVEGFDPATEIIYISGVPTWAEPGSDANLIMTDADNNLEYEITFQLEAGDYQFKFFRGAGWDGGEWTGEPNRIITVTGEMTYAVVWAGFPAGVNNIANQMVNVFPNPTSNILNISSVANVQIFDLNGKLVLDAQNTQMVNVSSLSEGLYIVKVATENETVTTKINVVR